MRRYIGFVIILIILYLLAAPASGQVRNPANGHEYWAVGSFTFGPAKDTAQKLGGHLVCIADSAEQAWLDSTLAMQGWIGMFWLGASDSVAEGEWHWQTGEPWSYTNWYTGEPNDNGNEDYAYMAGYLGGKWVDCGLTNSGTPWVLGALVEVDSHLVVLADSCTGPHSVRRVPSDYPTIQAAVNAACYGDTVLVAPGTYSGPGNTDILVAIKYLSIISEGGPESTVIDCNGSAAYPSRAFTFLLDLNRSSLIDGFTIRNGYAPQYQSFGHYQFELSPETIAGGAMMVIGPRYPVQEVPRVDEEMIIRNCRFEDCRSASTGGGIAALRITTRIENCRFSVDSANATGGAMTMLSCPSVSFDSCIFDRVYAMNGAALWIVGSTCRVSNATFFRNVAPFGWVIRADGDTTTINNSIVAFSTGQPVYSDNVSVSCTNIYGGDFGDWVDPLDTIMRDSDGNMSVPPMFCDTTTFTLYDISPCSPENNSCGQLIGAAPVNCTNHAPLAVTLIAPVSDSLPVYTLNPTFSWTAAADSDLADTARYRLDLFREPTASPFWYRDSILATAFPFPSFLGPDTKYWWQISARDRSGMTVPSEMKSFRTFTPGDLDTSFAADIADLTVLIDHLFLSITPVTPTICGDVTGDCRVDIADLTVLIDHLFLSFRPLQPGCE